MGLSLGFDCWLELDLGSGFELELIDAMRIDLDGELFEIIERFIPTRSISETDTTNILLIPLP